MLDSLDIMRPRFAVALSTGLSIVDASLPTGLSIVCVSILVGQTIGNG